MKKALLVAPIVMVLLAGCGSDLDLVKGGIMEFDQTTTVGQALDNWKSCKNRDWEEFEADNGVKIVQFSCQHSLSQYISKLKSLLPQTVNDKEGYPDTVSTVQTFQFTTNQDNTFQIDNVQMKITWADGTSHEQANEPVESLEYAYSNRLFWDPSELSSYNARQLNYILLTAYKTSRLINQQE